MKEIVILAGPNGAGKTTLARKLLPRFPDLGDFLNADEYARALSPANLELAAFTAGRKMLERMQEVIALEQSTTLAGLTYLRLLKRCKDAGWRITMLYLWLPSPEAAIKRVERRVKEGGHGLAPEVIQRRYFSGLSNLFRFYLPLADEIEVYDNSARRVRIAKGTDDGVILVLDSRRWLKMKRLSQCEP